MDAGDSAKQWLALLQRLASNVGHEVKNPLNGVAVNLEVVRSRATRAEIEPAQIRPFTEAAVAELNRTTALVSALLSVAGPAPADVADLLHPLVILYGAIAEANGGRMTLDHVDAGLLAAADPGEARLSIATVCDRLASAGARVRCTVEPHATMFLVRWYVTDLGSDPPLVLEAAGKVQESKVPFSFTVAYPSREREHAGKE